MILCCLFCLLEVQLQVVLRVPEEVALGDEGHLGPMKSEPPTPTRTPDNQFRQM